MTNLLTRLQERGSPSQKGTFQCHKAIIQKGNRGQGYPGKEGDVLKRAMSLGNVGEQQDKGSLGQRALK